MLKVLRSLIRCGYKGFNGESGESGELVGVRACERDIRFDFSFHKRVDGLGCYTGFESFVRVWDPGI